MLLRFSCLASENSNLEPSLTLICFMLGKEQRFLFQHPPPLEISSTVEYAECDSATPVVFCTYAPAEEALAAHVQLEKVESRVWVARIARDRTSVVDPYLAASVDRNIDFGCVATWRIAWWCPEGGNATVWDAFVG